MTENEIQAKACRALLASVVAAAVNDATIAPTKRQRDNSLPMHIDAFTAMRFLFDTSVSGLNEYATWLDFDPGQFRLKLKQIMVNESAIDKSGFDSMRRRYFRQNYGMWLQIQSGKFAVLDDSETEDDE